MSDEFPLPRSEEMLQRVGQHPAIDILDVDEETIQCRSLGVETMTVADLSDRITGYNSHAHAWREYEDGMYQTVCRHMTGVPITWLPNPASDSSAWRISLSDVERSNIPCDHCKHLLSDE